MNNSTIQTTNKCPRLGCLLFLLFVLSPAAVLSDTKQDQIRIIESNLNREKEKLLKFDSREKDLLSQVSALEREVDEKKRAVETVRENIRLARLEIKKLGDEQDRLEKKRLDTEKEASKRLVALYKYARQGYLKILSNFFEHDRFWQGIVYLKSIGELDRRELKTLSNECQKYKRLMQEIEDKINKRKSEENKEEKRLAFLRQNLEETVIQLVRIHEEKEFYQTAVKELQLAAQDMGQTFVKIEKKTHYKTSWTSRFEDLKRKLPFPVKGKVIKGAKLFGSKNLNGNKGVFIEGTDPEVKAVFPGRIDFSGSLKGYGEVVIINHGSRYYTISAQLGHRVREEGETVSEGDVIGLVEKNPKNGNTRLYFEIRKAGKSLDPLNWFGPL